MAPAKRLVGHRPFARRREQKARGRRQKAGGRRRRPRCADAGTRGRGDAGTGGHGDGETRRQGELWVVDRKRVAYLLPCACCFLPSRPSQLVTAPPCPRVPLSPCHRVPLSPC